MADRTTNEEAAAIAEAVATGKVQRIGRQKNKTPAPRVNWDTVPRRITSTVLDRRPARNPVRAELSVQEILDWAFRRECAQLELPIPEDAELGGGFGLEYVMIQRAKLGCQVQGGGYSEPHEDAEAVAAIVSNLPDIVGGKFWAIKVSEYARAGLSPDWMPDVTPRCVPVQMNLRGKGKTEVIEHVMVETTTNTKKRGVRTIQRRKEVRWTPVRYLPERAQIARSRADYTAWWFALSEIRRNLQASNMLRQHTVSNVMPPRAPWERKIR